MMRKLTLGIALILLVTLATPVMAASPNQNSQGSVAYSTPYCSCYEGYNGYSQIGQSMAFGGCYYYNTEVSDTAKMMHKP